MVGKADGRLRDSVAGIVNSSSFSLLKLISNPWVAPVRRVGVASVRRVGSLLCDGWGSHARDPSLGEFLSGAALRRASASRLRWVLNLWYTDFHSPPFWGLRSRKIRNSSVISSSERPAPALLNPPICRGKNLARPPLIPYRALPKESPCPSHGIVSFSVQQPAF